MYFLTSKVEDGPYKIDIFFSQVQYQHFHSPHMLKHLDNPSILSYIIKYRQDVAGYYKWPFGSSTIDVADSSVEAQPQNAHPANDATHGIKLHLQSMLSPEPSQCLGSNGDLAFDLFRGQRFGSSGLDLAVLARWGHA